MLTALFAAAFGWAVLGLAAVYAAGFVRAAHRATRVVGAGASTGADPGAGPGADSGADSGAGAAAGARTPPGPGVDRAGLLRRALAATTVLVAARALGPGHDLVPVLWGLLVAAWAWGLITSATAWRALPWRGGGSRGPRRTRADLVAESGLLVLAVAVLVP